MKFDVVIIGAGAAGLAAARDLSGAGKRVCIVEARERIGGRINTRRIDGVAMPIELGAEFIHGEAAATFAAVNAAPLIALQLPDTHFWSDHGKWSKRDDFWTRIARLRAKIPQRKRDVSFAEFLRSRRDVGPQLRDLAYNFVEGYHAAHADRISAAALRGSDEETEAPAQFRIVNGYDRVTQWLLAGVAPDRSELRLNTIVKRVEWRAGDVGVDTARDTIRARAAVITIPIGVWKAPHDSDGAIVFDPPLREKKRAIEKLELGHVVKIVFRFREPFWEPKVNFLHTNDRYIPTWWTYAPVRAPILIGWAGGHAADALLAESDEARVSRAIDSMAAAFDTKRRKIESLLVATYMHDWQADPFSRCAYSYAGVGGAEAHKSLAKPIARTLFFAGEATSGDETGTVAGAIESGRRAAGELLRVARAF
ncbi:MAG TPA: NAD(P)/FAD-dependent oxidoreductase [Thermoanaerobaculia bacterium]|nr:NAD(P)/FAD-dependent oxidoreductase [Thermoanaerobaculia bacterium]